jgi:hypothetical protein
LPFSVYAGARGPKVILTKDILSCGGWENLMSPAADALRAFEPAAAIST